MSVLFALVDLDDSTREAHESLQSRKKFILRAYKQLQPRQDKPASER